jgi:hypothetical protein
MNFTYRLVCQLRDYLLARRGWGCGSVPASPVRYVRPALEALEEILPINAFFSPFAPLLPTDRAAVPDAVAAFAVAAGSPPAATLVETAPEPQGPADGPTFVADAFFSADADNLPVALA